MKFDELLMGMMKEGESRCSLMGIWLSAPQVQQFCSSIQKKGDAKGLEELYLGGCGLGDGGVQAVMAALRENGSRLKVLDLYMNYIGDAGAKALAESIPRCPNLQELSLYTNSIGDEGVKALAESISYCPKLITLNIYPNKDSPANEALIDAALAGPRRASEVHYYSIPSAASLSTLRS